MEAPSISSKVARTWSKLIACLDPERGVLLALMGLALVLGVTYALITPPLVGPDEDVQYEYVQSLWDSGGTKVTGRASYHQPAYYWLDAPVYALTRSQPKEIQVVAMRLVSVGLLLGEVVLAYLSAKLLCPTNRFVYLATPAIVALLPGRGWIGATINDDNLASFSSTLVLYCFLRYLLRRSDLRGVVGLLASMLVAWMAKTTAWAVVVVIAAATATTAAARLWRRSNRLRRGVMIASLTAAAASLLVVAVGFVSVGTGQHTRDFLLGLEKVTPLRVGYVLDLFDWSKLSRIPPWQPGPFVHQFKTFWIPLWSDDYSAPDSEYQKAMLFSLIAAAGLLLSSMRGLRGILRRDIQSRQMMIVAVLFMVALSVWAASIALHLRVVAGTGSFIPPRDAWPPTHARYLFPALVPIAYFVAVGVGEFIPARMRPVGLAVFVTVFIYLNGIALWSILSHAYWWAA